MEQRGMHLVVASFDTLAESLASLLGHSHTLALVGCRKLKAQPHLEHVHAFAMQPRASGFFLGVRCSSRQGQRSASV